MSESAVLLEHHLKKLKLPSMLREYRKAAETCRELPPGREPQTNEEKT